VAVEPRGYARLVPAQRGAQGTLNVTTVEAGQERALVRLYIGGEGERREIKRIELRELAANSQRRTSIRLAASVSRRGLLTVVAYRAGRCLARESVSIKPYIAPVWPRRSAAAAAAVLVLLLAAWGIAQVDSVRDTIAGLLSESDADPRIEQPAGHAVDAERLDTAPSEVEPSEPPPSEAEPAEPEPSAEPEDGEDGEFAETPEAAPAPEVRHDSDVPPAALPVTVYFTPESAELRSPARERLDELLGAIAETDAILDLVGHTAIAGTEAGRRHLSVRRAQVVRDYLVQEGLDDSRIGAWRGVGAEEPATTDPEEQDRNRRVELRLSESE